MTVNTPSLRHTLRRWFGLLATGAALATFTTSSVRAESTPLLNSDNIGPALIPIASGTGVLVAGAGLSLSQPGTINFTVPTGSTIKQVLLYWDGFFLTATGGDDSAIVNGVTPVTGSLIGGPLQIVPGYEIASYRADITALVPSFSGPKSITVEGVNFSFRTNGAGVLVILDDGSGNTAGIQVRDGADFAYHGQVPGSMQTTVLQTYTFAPAATSRLARLSMMFSSVVGSASGGGFRPSSIEVNVGGTLNTLTDLLDSLDGQEWDSVNLNLPIPAGVSSVTVQAFSRADYPTAQDPASLDWINSTLSVPPPGQVFHGFTPGYWKNKANKKNLWPAPYIQSQLVTSAFAQASLYPTLASKTLLESLQGGGGPGITGAAQILLRAATAALLNSAAGINYPLSTAAVVSQVNAALASQDRATMLELASQLDLYNNLE